MSFLTDLKIGLETITAMLWYPLVLPQQPTLPAGTYQLISTVRGQSHNGDDGLPVRRVQLDVYGMTYAAVDAKSNLIESAFKNGKLTLGNTTIQHARMSNVMDGIDPTTGRYRKTLDLLLTAME